ncbi:MAG: cyclic nucleotide-binding domain-containing protein [Gammaproteobacteria bacterium]|nr:cyclic nucleotide-binding domain-containing protein [Gammaproteobacteria bacterium]
MPDDVLALFAAMRWQDWVGNACYTLLALSYVFTNMLWLRVLAIVSLGFEAVYFCFGASEPLWVGIAWNVAFVAINAVMLVLLLHERRQLLLSADEAILKRGLFADLDAMNFGRLLRIGEWVELPRGAVLTREGEPVDSFYVIADGLAEVDVAGHIVSILQDGSFVGEMSLLTNARASATVTTLAVCRGFRVGQSALVALLSRHPEIRAGLDRMIGRDLARKLRNTRGRPMGMNRAGELGSG